MADVRVLRHGNPRSHFCVPSGRVGEREGKVVECRNCGRQWRVVQKGGPNGYRIWKRKWFKTNAELPELSGG